MGISDHSLVYCSRKAALTRDKPKFVETRDFKNYLSEAFCRDLFYELNNNQKWLENDDPNIVWNIWKNKFQTIAEFHAPIRTRRVKSVYAPWLAHKRS